MEQLEKVFFETYLNRQENSRAYEYDDNHSYSMESLSTLGINEKLQIGTALLGDLNHDKSETHKRLESGIGKLSMQLQAVDMRLTDLEKDACSFKRDILTTIGGSNVGRSAGSTDTNCRKGVDQDSTAIVTMGGNGDKRNTKNETNSANTTNPMEPSNSAVTTTISSSSTPSISTNTIPPTIIIKNEKIIRHFQNKSLQLDTTKDKLKLQQIAQRSKLQKIEHKLKQKDDYEIGSGDSDGGGKNTNFNYIDVHTFQSSNKQYKKELNVITTQLEKTKVMFEISEKKLVTLRGTLEKYEKEKLNVEKSIDLRQRHLQRLKDKVQRHKDNIEGINMDQQRMNNCSDLNEMSTEDDVDNSKDNFNDNVNNDEVVDVMDIVDQQSQLYELKSLIKTWTRKVEIAQLARRNKKVSP